MTMKRCTIKTHSRFPWAVAPAVGSAIILNKFLDMLLKWISKVVVGAMRKLKVQNYITGRWVLTIKRDKEGNFEKCKA